MVTLQSTFLEIALAHNSNAKFHYLWLRDNCHCRDCRHPSTSERILVSADISVDLQAESARTTDQTLEVIWSGDQHRSQYSLEWLAQYDYSQAPQASNRLKTWGRELEPDIPTFDYIELYNRPDSLLSFCEAVRDIGLCIVRDAPIEEGEIERFAEHIACVRETIYDRLHNVRATPDQYNAYNVASTTLELKPHTDMPNYNNPPGVQMFHFLVNDSIGGESTAVDGAHVSNILKQSDPEAYRILSTTPMSFRMFSDRGDIANSNPLFSLDVHGELKVFRYSNQLAQPLALEPDKVHAFYQAYIKLGKLIDAPENKVQFRLNTGDIMVTNNLRVLHGRNSYAPSSGGRHLQLSYMDYDDVLSRICMLKKKK